MMKSLLSQIFPPPPSSNKFVKFEANKNWLIFIFLTFLLLYGSSFIQREFQFFQGRTAAYPGDFQVYYTAGLVVRQTDDKRLYSYRENPDEKSKIINPQLDYANPDSVFAKVSNETFGSSARNEKSITQYLYPPFSALLISPLTFLSFQNAAILWYVITFLLIWASIFLTVKIFHQKGFNAFLISSLITFLAEFTFPMQDLLWAGNIGAIILFCCVAGIFFQAKDYAKLSAFFIALAVFIKLTPLIIVPLMIIRRKWNWLLAFGGWSMLLFALSLWQLGWHNHQEFLTKIMPSMSSGIAERNNRSLISIFQFVELQKVTTIEDLIEGKTVLSEKMTWLYKITLGLVFVGILFYLWRFENGLGLVTELFLLLLLTLVISPISWRHSFILAVAPLTYLWLYPLTQKSAIFKFLMLSAATICIFSILPDYALTVLKDFWFQLMMVSVMPLGVLITIYLFLQLTEKKDELQKNPANV